MRAYTSKRTKLERERERVCLELTLVSLAPSSVHHAERSTMGFARGLPNWAALKDFKRREAYAGASTRRCPPPHPR